mgnify:CR=1 FL=1
MSRLFRSVKTVKLFRNKARLIKDRVVQLVEQIMFQINFLAKQYLFWSALIASIFLAGCSAKEPPVESYGELSPNLQVEIDRAVQEYIRCSVATSLTIDDGLRHAGRLAWTATELCEAKKLAVIQRMSEGGASYEASIRYSSDSQVRATAAGIDAIQKARGADR